MTKLLQSTCLALILASPALGDTALLLGNRDYDALGNVRGAEDIVAARESLGGWAFDIDTARNADTRALIDRLERFVAVSDEDDALLIALSGQFRTDGRRTWFMGTDARNPTLVSVGRHGISVETVMDILARSQGRAILFLGAPDDDGRAGDLREGIGDLEVPQGVIVLTGPPAAMARAVERLGRDGATLGQITRDRGVVGMGFVPSNWRLEGVVERTGPAATTAARTPAEEAEAGEQALALDRDARREIQRDLTLLGYNTRGIDGIFGPGTRSAIGSWQGANDFRTTNFLTADQITRLDAQAERRATELELEAERQRAETLRQDLAYWEETGSKGDEAGLRAYLRRFPDGEFAEVAEERLASLTAAKMEDAGAADRQAWAEARDANTVAGYRRYLENQPDGAFRREAEQRLTGLEQEDRFAEAAREEQALGLNRVTAQLIESRLEQQGLKPGKVDGVFDDDTRKALRRYQQARDLPVTGYMNEPTAVRLLADSVGSIFR